MDEFNNNNGFGEIPNPEGQPDPNQFQQNQQPMYNQNMNQYQPQQPVNNQYQQPMYNQNMNQFQNPDYVQVTESYTPNYNNYNNNGGSSKKPLVILAIIAVLIFALAGIAFAAYKFVPGMILSGKDAYFAMEAKSIQSLMKIVEENLGEDYEAMLEKPMKSDMKITANVEGNIPAESKAMIETLLKNASIELKTQSDYKNEYESVEMDLKLSGEEFNLDYQCDNNQIAIALKPLYDRYITVDGNNLTPIWKLLEVEDGPKKLLSSKDLIETIELTDDEEEYLEKAGKEYLELIKKNINGKNFTTKKGETLEYKDNEIKCNIVEYEFTQEDGYNSAKAVLTKLKDDDKTLEIVFGKLNKIYKLYEEAGYTMTGDELPTVDEVKESIEQTLEDLDDEYDEETKDDIGITVRNYYTNDLTVLKREFVTTSTDYYFEENPIANLDMQPKSKENKLELYTINNKEDAYYALAAEDSVMYVDIVKGKEKDEYNIAITNSDEETLELPITVEKKSDNEQLIKGALNIPNNDEVKITFECTVKEEKETTDFDLDIKLTDNEQNIDVVISIEDTTERNATIEKIDVSNAWDIAKASQSEITTEFNKIQSNLMSLYFKFAGVSINSYDNNAFISTYDNNRTTANKIKAEMVANILRAGVESYKLPVIPTEMTPIDQIENIEYLYNNPSSNEDLIDNSSSVSGAKFNVKLEGSSICIYAADGITLLYRE